MNIRWGVLRFVVVTGGVLTYGAACEVTVLRVLCTPRWDN